jgi:hypothetical protein
MEEPVYPVISYVEAVQLLVSSNKGTSMKRNQKFFKTKPPYKKAAYQINAANPEKVIHN